MTLTFTGILVHTLEGGGVGWFDMGFSKVFDSCLGVYARHLLTWAVCGSTAAVSLELRDTNMANGKWFFVLARYLGTVLAFAFRHYLSVLFFITMGVSWAVSYAMFSLSFRDAKALLHSFLVAAAIGASAVIFNVVKQSDDPY